MIFLILLIAGLLAGLFGALLGLGGGIILVPVLLAIHHVSTAVEPISHQTAVGTSLILIILTAVSSTLAYHKQGKINYPIGSVFMIGVVPGAIVGSSINEHMPNGNFELYFGLMAFFLFLILVNRNRLTALQIKTDRSGPLWLRYLPALCIAFVVGMISGLFGIGGGALMVPTMIIFFAFAPQMATATSMFVILASAFAGSLTHLYYGNINWLYVLSVAPGTLLGGWLGAVISKKIGGLRVEWLLRSSLIFISFMMVYRHFN